MKKAQTTVEYILLFVFATLICALIMAFWNRDAIINGGPFGVQDQTGAVHIRGLTE